MAEVPSTEAASTISKGASKIECVCNGCKSSGTLNKFSRCVKDVESEAHTNDVATRIILSSEMMTIVLTRKDEPSLTKRFSCHKALLSHFSPYFDAACNNIGFVEAEASEIVLEDDDPAEVEAFVQWLYTGRVKNDIGGRYLVGSWIIGDKFLCPTFCNTVMYSIFDWYSHHRSVPSEVRHVYANTLVDSPLRWFIRSVVATDINVEKTRERSTIDEVKKVHDWDDWKVLLSEGGDFAVDFALKTFYERNPWESKNQAQYLLPVDEKYQRKAPKDVKD